MMIETIKDYREEILKFKSELGQQQVILYRGQSNHSWNIKSSLERHGIEIIECERYYRIIDKYKPLINPLIENRYERKSTRNGYPFDFKEYEKGSWELPEMEYLAYLRHHGFPTPLVDLSSSCFVALFFACEDFNQERKEDGKIFYTLLLKLGLEGMIFLTYERLADTSKQENATLRNSLNTLFPLYMILNGNL